MTVVSWLKSAARDLEQAGISTARLDAMILLEDVTSIDRAFLLAKPDQQLTAGQIAKLNNLLSKRARHIPLAYLRGRSEFYGREFVITPAVLQPRPETETLIDELRKLQDIPVKPYIVDVGTGSGCLGITAALELPAALVELVEIDDEAAEVAQMNVDKFTLNLTVTMGHLLDQTSSVADILLCNLPYVPDGYQVNEAAGHEPRIALFGGKDGLDLYHELFNQVSSLKKQPLYILSESFPSQHTQMRSMASEAGYETISENDFILVQKRIQ